MVCFLGCERTLPAHVELLIHQYPQVLLLSAALKPLSVQPVLVFLSEEINKGREMTEILTLVLLQRGVVLRNGLPREAVEAPSLEAFKARLDGALSNLV